MFLMGISIWMLQSGCMSTSTYRNSRDEVHREKPIELRASGDEVSVGVNVSKLEVLRKHWVKQILSAIVDGVCAWGVKEGLDNISNQ